MQKNTKRKRIACTTAQWGEKMDKEIGRMQKRYYCRDIVLQESVEDDQKVVMIREYTTSEKFNGFTKNSLQSRNLIIVSQL